MQEHYICLSGQPSLPRAVLPPFGAQMHSQKQQGKGPAVLGCIRSLSLQINASAASQGSLGFSLPCKCSPQDLGCMILKIRSISYSVFGQDIMGVTRFRVTSTVNRWGLHFLTGYIEKRKPKKQGHRNPPEAMRSNRCLYTFTLLRYGTKICRVGNASLCLFEAAKRNPPWRFRHVRR